MLSANDLLEANVIHLLPTRGICVTVILLSSMIDTIVLKLEHHFNEGNKSIQQICATDAPFQIDFRDSN